MTLAFGMLQPLIQGVIEEKTARQQFLVVGYSRERPREMASSPADPAHGSLV